MEKKKYVIEQAYEQIAYYVVEAKDEKNALRRFKEGKAIEVDWRRGAEIGSPSVEKEECEVWI